MDTTLLYKQLETPNSGLRHGRGTFETVPGIRDSLDAQRPFVRDQLTRQRDTRHLLQASPCLRMCIVESAL